MKVLFIDTKHFSENDFPESMNDICVFVDNAQCLFPTRLGLGTNSSKI